MAESGQKHRPGQRLLSLYEIMNNDHTCLLACRMKMILFTRSSCLVPHACTMSLHLSHHISHSYRTHQLMSRYYTWCVPGHVSYYIVNCGFTRSLKTNGRRITREKHNIQRSFMEFWLFTVTNVYPICCHKFLCCLLSQISILFSVTNICPICCHKYLSYLLSQISILISVTNVYPIYCHKQRSLFLSQIAMLFAVTNIYAIYCHKYLSYLVSKISFLSHFKKRLNIIFDFIPMIVFLFCMFGYLVILIFVKWIKYPSSKSHMAPSLLIGKRSATLRISHLYHDCHRCLVACQLAWEIMHLNSFHSLSEA